MPECRPWKLLRRLLWAVLPVLPLLGQAQALPPGDAQRGAAIAQSRSQGLCVLCHAVPGLPESQWGSLGPPLQGVGARLTADELRQRLEAPERFNPETLMPSYSRHDGLQQVARSRQGQALFTPQQLADVLAWLVLLK